MAWEQRNIWWTTIWISTDTYTEYDKRWYNYFWLNKKWERDPNYVEKNDDKVEVIENKQEEIYKKQVSNQLKFKEESKQIKEEKKWESGIASFVKKIFWNKNEVKSQEVEQKIEEIEEVVEDDSMIFDKKFFKSDLEVNKKLIKNYLNIWLEDVKNEDEQFSALVDDFWDTRDEDTRIAIENEIFLNRATRKKNPPSIQDSLLDPYFFFCTDDNLTYISNKDIDIRDWEKRIIPFTSARAWKLRFDDSWDNKFELIIKDWKLISAKQLWKAKNSWYSLKSKDIKSIDEILNERKTKTWWEKKVWVWDISKLIQEEQNKIMSAPADGTVLITWVAWSWKTNVLLHRIQYLLWEQPSEYHFFHEDNMIFLCFNKALQRYIESSTKNWKFPSIIVKTIDQWIIDLFRETFDSYEIKLDIDNDISFEEIKTLVDEFVSSLTKETLESLLDKKQKWYVKKHWFIQYELQYNPKLLRIITKEKSIREYTKKHLFVWCYLLSITKLIQDEWVNRYKIKIWEREFLWFSGDDRIVSEINFVFKRPFYDHIFIDEVQDLSKVQMKIVDWFHKNSLTIAWDESQLVMVSQLWNNLASIFDINIDYKYELKTSHRNSQQTALFANEFLKWIKYKHTIESISFKWLKPLVKNVNSAKWELDYLVDKIFTLQNEEPDASICVMYPRKTSSYNDNSVDWAIKYLSNKWIDCYNANWLYWDFSRKVHVTNYHQAKWLEFDYVFICGINDFDTWNIRNKNNLIYTLITRWIKRVYITIQWQLPKLLEWIDTNTYILQ